MKRITLLLLMLVALVLAACSGNQASSSPTPTPTTAATETAAAPTEEPTPDPVAEATLQPGAGDLAALLPTEVGGIAIEYQSSSGADVMGSGGVTPETQEFFDRVGAEPSDLSSAFGLAIDPTSGEGITIIALRVAGVDEGRLREEFRASIEQDDTQTISETQVAGKDALLIGTPDEPDGGYVYVKNDVVFIVGGTPMSLVEEAFSKLP